MGLLRRCLTGTFRLMEDPSFVSGASAVLRHRAKHLIGKYPRLYNLVFRFRDGYENRLVSDETDICIEGFPRSANSFAVGAFEDAQDESLTIAHHNHVPAPVMNAVRCGVPAIALVRDPVEAIVSNRALQLQTSVRSGGVSASLAVSDEAQLGAWISFYKRVESVRDKVIVAPFPLVIEDFGSVIQAVNTKFGTDFTPFVHTPDRVDKIRKRGYHALPSAQREKLKQEARDYFEREVGADHSRVQEARRLYRQFVETVTYAGYAE